MLIRNARLVALDDPATTSSYDTSEPVDVLVEDGAVGRIGPGLTHEGEVVDAEGRWLMPGLWDQHVHLAQWTLSSARLDMAPARSAAQAVELVAERLAEAPDRPVIGYGHRPTAWPDEPLVGMLDALDTHQPIVLISGDAHHAWLNTTALIHLALPVRQGMVAETEWFSIFGRLRTILGDDGTGPDSYRRTMEDAAALGVVGLTDYEFSGGVDDWLARWSEGADLVRVRMATYADGLDDVLARGLRSGDPLADDPRLTMGSLKIISDGSLNTRTAWCCEPYAGPSPLGFPYGEPNQTSEELRALLTRATTHGLTVAVHALGDRAVAEALDAFAATGARGTIEHAQLVRREDVRRLADLGITASVQPAHLLDDREVSDRLWPDRGGRSFALRWMLDEGVRLAMGSDAPVARLDPWLAVAAAIHRGLDDDAWHPEQSITAREALAASTDGWGTVAVGHPADFVLLDADPLAGDDDAAHAATLRGFADHVVGTWVAGRQVF